MRRGFLVWTLILIILMIPFSSVSPGVVSSEPDEISVDIIQGGSTERNIIIRNDNNETFIGYIIVLNVECGCSCPGAHLSVSQDELVELEPNETMNVTVYVTSCIMTNVQELTLPIQYYKSYTSEGVTIAEIYISVHRNYYVYVGIPVIVICIIIGTIWLIKRKPRISE